MKTTFAIIAVAAAMLAGCNKEDHTIVAGGPDTHDPEAAALEANGPVELPPSISASKTYRCANGKIVSIGWMSDNKSATVTAGEGASPVLVNAAEEGQPMTSADGYAVSGSASAGTVKVTLPGSGEQSCKG